ncbi:MAG: hypothetical protein K0Q77_2400 [Anaerosporomusa subterranea]|jgi:hypothetical protein|nr:hypothetical protein [Anaerosporomusa subterranea]
MEQDVRKISPQGLMFYSAQALPRYSMVEALADNLASEFCRKLYSSIQQFDEQLDNTLEVGMRLVAFGQAITFSVSRLGYTDPSLIHFYGRLDNGQPVELVQHVSQISFLLTAIPRLNPDKPKSQIGFLRPVDACDKSDD